MICKGQCSLACIRRENDKDRKDSGERRHKKRGSPKGARKHQSNGWDRLSQLLHRFQNGVVVRLVGHFGHQLAVSQCTVGSHHEDGVGQQT